MNEYLLRSNKIPYPAQARHTRARARARVRLVCGCARTFAMRYFANQSSRASHMVQFPRISLKEISPSLLFARSFLRRGSTSPALFFFVLFPCVRPRSPSPLRSLSLLSWHAKTKAKPWPADFVEPWPTKKPSAKRIAGPPLSPLPFSTLRILTRPDRQIRRASRLLFYRRGPFLARYATIHGKYRERFLINWSHGEQRLWKVASGFCETGKWERAGASSGSFLVIAGKGKDEGGWCRVR